MPPSLILDNAHINTVCTKVQLAAGACPAGSVMGTAKAVSPLLEKPLEGTVYLATGYGHKLPDVLAVLKGQVDVNLDGVVSTKNAGLRTSFETVPDVPVTEFTLNLSGGKRGLLQTSANNLCAQVRRATVNMTGQNNRRANSRPIDPPVVRQALRPRQPEASGLVEEDGEMTGSRTMLGRRIHLAILGACLATAMSLFAAGPAEALQYMPHTLEKSIDGSETPSGSFNFDVISVGGRPAERQPLRRRPTVPCIKLFKFTAQGAPSAFTDPSLGGSSEITVAAQAKASSATPRSRSTTPGGPYQGRIYVKNRYDLNASGPSNPAARKSAATFRSLTAGNGMAVSPANGNFFVSGVPLESRAYEYSPDGLKTGVVVDMSQNGYTYGEIEAGPHSEVFAFSGELGIQKYNTASELIDHFPAGGSTIFGIDPVSGDLLVRAV